MSLVPLENYQSEQHQDVWENLKKFTDARIAIGRAGCSIPTHEMLKFQLAHAEAQDAVHQALDVDLLVSSFKTQSLDSLTVHSQAEDKQEYLKRPDLGRLLNSESYRGLQMFKASNPQAYDVCIVIGDGLSARAIEENAVPFIQHLIPHLQAEHWSIAPIVIATGSRVALGDQVAECLHATMLVMLIGERPGLSSPDSMGIYYTWKASTGTLDAKRNCISNVRPAGLSILIATQRLMSLMRGSKKLGYSGVELKDEHEMVSLDTAHTPKRLF
ncbi:MULTISPECIES: ethanolamine ammonia-lyase subunit EutC [unclassified Acinetobacter]|uniref:ethanolamine ammonia-lyase subunit EutC n=1 Tax=unclassified Acinetobacter TaxID=196816 RepID=UPI000DA69BBC|nr:MULTISPECIES: ethanolamine ammonia-lyase subunit EutC [unclassified Acinetobacter]